PMSVVTAGDPVLLTAGDIANCTIDTSLATADIIRLLPRATIATLGDQVYVDGTPTEFATCYEPRWGFVKSQTHPAAGNHEYQTAAAAGYFGYFGAAAGDASKGYYSFDVGAWHIVVLNANCVQVACGVGSPQLQWLHDDLAAHQNACTL